MHTTNPPRSSAWISLLSLVTACAFTTVAAPLAQAMPITVEGINWSLTLDEPEQSAPAGSQIVFSGSIQNRSGSDLIITGANIGFSFIFDDDDEEEEEEEEEEFDVGLELAEEFLATSGIISPAGYFGPLFVVRWGDDLEADLEGEGNFELLVDLPGDPSSLSIDFEAEVAVPIPGTLLLMLLVGPAFLLMQFGIRRRDT